MACAGTNSANRHSTERSDLSGYRHRGALFSEAQPQLPPVILANVAGMGGGGMGGVNIRDMRVVNTYDNGKGRDEGKGEGGKGEGWWGWGG